MLKPVPIIAIAVFVLLAGCQPKATTPPPPNHILQLPPRDVLDISDQEHVRGTKLVIRVPYSYIRQDSGIFRKTAKAYIQVWPSDTPGFDIARPGIEAGFAKAHYDSLNGPLYDHQEVAIGGWDGLLSYAVEPTAHMEHVTVVFGDHLSSYKAEGFFPAGDGAERDTILASLFSLTEDGAIDHAFHHTLATEHSGWWYNGAVGNVYYYSPNQDAHRFGDLQTDECMVIQFKPAQGFSASIRNLEAFLQSFRRLGLQFPPYTIVPIQIGNMDAVEVACEATYRGKPNAFYAVLTGTRAQPLLLAGWVYNNDRARIASMKRVASTLRVK